MSKKIIGATVGTTISPNRIAAKIKPVKTVNNTAPDENGNVNVKTAYEYAKEGGYAGTEAEFAAKLAAEYIPANTATDHVAIFGTDSYGVKIGGGDITFMYQGNEGVYVYCENGDGRLVFYGLSGDQPVRLENIATPTNVGDAANKSYVDSLTTDKAEEWTFTLEDGSTVTKKVVLG